MNAETNSGHLSPDGARRRDAMLEELTGAFVRHHRRRRRVRHVGGAVLVALLAVTAGIAGTVRRPGPTSVAPPHAALPLAPTATGCVIVRVNTERGAAARYAAPSSGTGVVVTIDDDTLLTTLAGLGRPSGLAEVAGRVRLVARGDS